GVDLRRRDARRGIAQRLRGQPVLAVAAVKVAAEHAEGEAVLAGQDVEERFLLDRVRLERRHVAGGDHQRAALVPAHLADAAPAIDWMWLRRHSRFLADDLLEGRDTGSRGADLAALYLAAESERLGLVGAAAGGSWFQDVPLIDATIDTAASRLTITDSLGTS